RGGELYAEELPVAHIAAAVGTPFYLYSAAGFTAHYRRFADAFLPERPLICYAVKANSNLAVLRLLAGLGAGADVVSEGELRRALAAELPGIEPVGLAVHIGSQLTDLEPYRRAFERVAELVLELSALGLSVARMDLGGGIGVRYHAERPLEPASYANLVRHVLGSL